MSFVPIQTTSISWDAKVKCESFYMKGWVKHSTGKVLKLNIKTINAYIQAEGMIKGVMLAMSTKGLSAL